MTYNPTAATLDSVLTNYVTDGATETDIYSQNHGNVVHSDFHFRAQSAGTLNFFYTVLDHSGNSYHYNADFGNAIVVPVQPQQALTKSVDKATANPGDSLTYTLNYANLGNIDLSNVVITETYDSRFIFTSSVPTPSGGNNIWNIGTLPVGASGTITIHGTLSSSFPFGTTNVHNVAVMTSDQTDPVQGTADTSVYVAPLGSIQLTKVVDSGSASASDFSFTISPDPNGVGAVHTSAGSTGTYTFSNLPASSSPYTITEQPLSGYHQVSSTCANITVTAGQQSTCTVHNARDQGSIELKKVWSGTPGQTTLNIGTLAGGSQVDSQLTGAAGAAPLTTGSHTVFTGTYYVSETGGLTNYSAALACTDDGNPMTPGANNAVSVAKNHTVVCTFTNTRDQGTIELKKVWSGTPGQTTLNIGSTAGGNQVDAQLTGAAGAAPLTTGTNSVNTGIYYLSETGGLSDYTPSLECLDNGSPVTPGANNSMTVAKDHVVVCTFTNTRNQGTVIFQKIVDNEPNADLSQFTFHANGGTYHDGSSAAFNTGSYPVTEDAVSGYTFVGASGICSYNPTNGQITMNVGANGGTCTITNHRDTGTLVIQKDVINPDGGPVSDTHQFTVSVTGQSNGAIAEGTNATYSNLPTGTYTVTELADGSYTFVSYSLDNNANAADGAQVTVTKNGTATLLVTNQQKKVSIIVHKNVVGIDGQTDVSDAHGFTAMVNGQPGAIAEGTNFTTQVNPGSVTVTENADANYALVSITPSNFSVTSGQSTVDVYVVNKQLPAHITVYKDVRAWDGSDTADGHTFQTTLNSETKTFGESAPAVFAVAPGTYSASETSDPNYTLGSILPDHVTVGSNGQASITITNLQNKVFDWTVSKSAPATVQAGGQMTYAINWQVNANSNTQLANMTVSDLLPPHTSFVSCTDSCTHSGNPITWSIGGPFVPGQTGTVHVTVQVDNHLDPLTMTNTATVCGDQQPYFAPLDFSALSVTSVINPTHVCKDGSARTDVLSSYELGLTKTDNQTTTTPGSTFSYIIHWSVDGNAATTSALQVTDTLPAHVTFVSATSGITPVGNVLTWNLGSKNVPDSGDLTVTVKTDAVIANGTILHNTAQICDGSDQCAEASDNTTVVSSFNVTIVKSDNVDPVQAGSPVTYTLNWSVSGNAPINNVVVSDDLSAIAPFVNTITPSGGVYDGGTHIVTWNLGPKAANDSGSVTVTVTVNTPLTNGTVLNDSGQVCASSFGANEQTTTHCATDTETTTVQSLPIISIDKTGPATITAGSTLTYSLAWSVSGNAPATNAVITDPIPANTSFVSAACGTTVGTCTVNSTASTISWNLGTRNPGESGTVTVVVKAASPLANATILVNTGTFDTTETPPVSDTVNTTVQSAPSISITKTNDVAGFTNPGKTATYTVVVTNAASATDTAQSVNLTDVLPAGFTYVVGGGTTKTFALGNLAPGASVTTVYAAVISANQTGGIYTNTATAKGTNTSSISATSNVEVRIPQVLGATANPQITITKTANPTTTNPGKIVTYTVTIANVGDADATNVAISDTLPAGFTFVDGGQTTRTWNIGTLAANHQRVIDYQVRVGTDVKGGSYKNLAIVTADGLDPNKASATVTVIVPKVLGLATTGVSMRDYLVFTFGLAAMTLGLLWINRLRRQYDES
ncbi:MAG: DUF11 domain-containing protein [Candidatus Kerfeldbacteria bacterium]|nr:DUF11 domain-containing protein [Candidatus Kerfeldbacteria bacterium]